MTADRRTARVVGALFLIAMVTSLLGGVWLESMLDAPDYLTSISANETAVMIGVLLELVNCVAVVGIAAALFPVLKRYGEALALGYLGIRVVEAVVLSIAAISPLLAVTLSEGYLAGQADASYYQALSTTVLAARTELASLLTPVFFAAGALLLYGALYRTRLVPRLISVWGILAVALMLAWNLLEAFGISISAGMAFGLPIILNEILLGIWLILKGFSSSAIASGTAETGPDELEVAYAR